MLRVARHSIAIATTALVLAGCDESSGVAGPEPTVAQVTMTGLPPDGVMIVGDTLSLGASVSDREGTPLSDRTVSWSSSDPAVATVSAIGVVTGRAVGAVTVRATSDGVADTARLSVRVTIAFPSPDATVPMVQTVLDGRVTMSIPPGAVPASVTLLTVGPANSPPATAELLGGTAFEFGPSGTFFAMPLTLTLRFDAGSVPVGERAGLAIYHVIAGDYQEVYGSVVDTSANEVSAPISSFSSYAILRRAAPAAVAVNTGNNQTTGAGTNVFVRPAVRVTDVRGRAVSFARVTFAAVSGGGSIDGAEQLTNADGVAIVGSWTLGPAAGTNTLSATVSGLSPVMFSATGVATAATQLVVTTQPVAAAAGSPLSAVVITARDVHGNTATAFSGPVSLALESPSEGATLGGATTINAVSGIATFTTLTVNRAGTGYTLVASSEGLTSAATNAFDVTTGAAARLVFTQQPTSTMAGESLGAVQVGAQDAAGNMIPSFAGVVQIVLGANPGASGLTGTLTATAGAGLATFSGLSLNRSGDGYTLIASSSGLASGASGAFNIIAGPAALLALVGGGGQTGVAGAALAQPIVMQVTDALGNPVDAAGRVVNFAVVTGGGSVAPAGTTTNASGQASTVWTLGDVGGAQGINATSAGLGTLGVTASARVPSALTLTSGGGQSAGAGAMLPQPIVVKVSDAAGVGVPGQTVTFAVTMGGGSVAPAGAISNAQGMASASWTLGTVEGAQTLTATAGFTSAVVTVNATLSLPPLYISLYQDYYSYTRTLGIGQYRGAFVWAADGAQTPRVVTLSHTGTARANAPATVTIPAGESTVHFSVAGTSAGTDVLVASAPGFASATLTTDVDKGHLSLDAPSPLKAQDSALVTLAPLSPDGFVNAVVAAETFTLTASAHIQFVSGGTSSAVITSVTIPADGNFVQFWVKGVAPGAASYTITNAHYETFTGALNVTALPPTPTMLTLMSGGGQSGGASAVLPQPIVVKVSTAAGVPIAGQTVTFAVATGNGNVEPSSGTSDAQGLVTTAWTLGPGGGAQTIVASTSDAPAALTIGATATAHALRLDSGDFTSQGQYWPPIGIGQYRSGARVWREQGDAALTVTFSHTGIAHTSLPVSVIPAGSGYDEFAIAGTSAGTDEFVAAAPGYTPATASIVVGKGALSLELPTSLGVADSVPVTLYVLGPDARFVNGVVEATTFALAPNANLQCMSGGVSSAVVTSVTIPAGQRFIEFWLKGVSTGQASLAVANADYQAFSATFSVIPESPVVLVLDSDGGHSASVDATLAPIIVRVTDALGRPIAGRTVTFVVTAGGGRVSPSSGTTNATGQVWTSWTLGPVLGAQTMTASASLTPTVLTISATAIVSPLHFASGDYYFDYYNNGAPFPSLGIGQSRDGAYVWTEHAVGSPLTVTLSHAGTARTSVPMTVTIPAGGSTGFFTVTGTSAGIDGLVATAVGYSSATVSSVVDKGRIFFDYRGPSPEVHDSVLVEVMLQTPENGAYFTGLAAATTFALTPNANIQVVSGGASSAVITSITIPAGETSVAVWVKGVVPGTGSLTITNADYQSFTGSILVLPSAPSAATAVTRSPAHLGQRINR